MCIIRGTCHHPRHRLIEFQGMQQPVPLKPNELRASGILSAGELSPPLSRGDVHPIMSALSLLKIVVAHLVLEAVVFFFSFRCMDDTCSSSKLGKNHSAAHEP